MTTELKHEKKFGPYLMANADGQLVFDRVSLTDLAKQYGTPLFVLSENTLRHQIKKIHTAFTNHYGAEVIVCVGMKGNPGLAVRRVVVLSGGGGDAFGLGELTLAMLAGSDPRKIVMNGANKSRETIEAAIDMGVMNQVDNIDELQLTQQVAKHLGKKARVSLRLRLPLANLKDINYVDARYPDGISPAYWERTFKFGLEPENYVKAVKLALTMPEITLEGMHYHGGIPRRAGFYKEETVELVELIAEFKKTTGWAPQYLNIGGGFVTERYGADQPPKIEDYARDICGAIMDVAKKSGLALPVLMLEPGRYCVEAAGVFLTRVGATKTDTSLAKKKWVYVDGNSNEMRDPFDPRVSVHHVVIANDVMRGGTERVDVCGQTCNAADILAKARDLPPVKIGDLLAFLDVGAYNESFACQSNIIPRSASVMVNAGRSAVVRRRETVADVLAREQIPNWLMG